MAVQRGNATAVMGCARGCPTFLFVLFCCCFYFWVLGVGFSLLYFLTLVAQLLYHVNIYFLTVAVINSFVFKFSIKENKLMKKKN